MKKQLAIIGAVAAVSTAGLAGAAIANAATTTSGTNPMSSLVDAIASKFKLNKTDVQAVFDEQHAKMEADRETEVKAEVAQLVTDGTLTQAKADAINAKRAELQKERDANRAADQNLTQDQRRANMDERRAALNAWLKEQGIDQKYAYLLMGGRGHGPGSMPGMRGTQNSPSDSR